DRVVGRQRRLPSGRRTDRRGAADVVAACRPAGEPARRRAGRGGSGARAGRRRAGRCPRAHGRARAGGRHGARALRQRPRSARV
ncbi:MAG: hypothetical protein AVDCRST_MAG45-1726, partial [uncultured Solirubrobacterales bacterium]